MPGPNFHPSCRAAWSSAPASPARSRSIPSCCSSTSRPPGLDPIAAAAFDELIRSLQKRLGLTVFLITHDLDTLHAICDRIAVLADKRVIGGRNDPGTLGFGSSLDTRVF